jgi:hypothetical protein
MPKDETVDEQTVQKLSGLPPYFDKDGNVVAEAPVEETPEEEEPKKEVPEEEPQEEKQEEPQEKQEEPEEAEETPSEDEALENSKNPERTKKFIDKLKEQNKELRKPKKDILSSLEPEAPQWPEAPTTNVIPTTEQFPGVPQSQITEAFKGLVDEGGYVDSGLLIGTLKDLQEKNRLANEEVVKSRQEVQKTNKRLDDFERNETMRAIHEKFPKLNPVNVSEELPEDKKFNDSLWEYVRKNMVSEWVNEASSGKIDLNKSKEQLDRERMERITQKGMDLLNAGVLNDEGEVDISLLNMKKEEKVKVEEAEMAKKNINALGVKGGSQRESYSSHDELISAAQRGKRGALEELLTKSGH